MSGSGNLGPHLPDSLCGSESYIVVAIFLQTPQSIVPCVVIADLHIAPCLNSSATPIDGVGIRY